MHIEELVLQRHVFPELIHTSVRTHPIRFALCFSIGYGKHSIVSSTEALFKGGPVLFLFCFWGAGVVGNEQAGNERAYLL